MLAPCFPLSFKTYTLYRTPSLYLSYLTKANVKKVSLCLLFIAILISLPGCHTPLSNGYYVQYIHLEKQRECKKIEEPQLNEWPYSLTLLVDAKHLDYRGIQPLLKTIANHPRTGSTCRTVGHAWILLRGWKEGKQINLEGGHSGELGDNAPSYLDGVFYLAQQGNLSIKAPFSSVDSNPVRYLFTPLNDGFFQIGSGGHVPSFAAITPLKKEQFDTIYSYIQKDLYGFAHYDIQSYQCVDFVAKIALLAGIHLKHRLEIPIEKSISFQGKLVQLWSDPQYRLITISSPDVLEKSLIELVLKGTLLPASKWYRQYQSSR